MSSTRDYLNHVRREYGLSPDEYRALFYAQGGACYVCRRAKGISKRLGVDHNHLTGEVRALVCTGSTSANTCNRLVARYTREALLRGAVLLGDPPPARSILGPMRDGITEGLPLLAREGTFDLKAVRGADI